MGAISDLKEYKLLIEKELEIYFDKKLDLFKDLDPFTCEMLELIKEYTLRGGKRIRAALVYYGYLLFKNENLEEIKKASMSMELTQSYLLMLDDFMDRDDKRRGGKTAHFFYQLFHTKENLKGDKVHFGNTMATLAGSMCNHFANGILCDINLDSERKVAAIKELNRLIPFVIHGQNLDVLEGVRTGISENIIIQIHKFKTATYTFEAPLRIGAILAGASENQLQILTDFSIPLGIAFQIQDDILGIYGDEKKLGKPVGSDLIEGKKTLLVSKVYELGTAEQKQFLKDCLGNKNITEADIEKVRQIVIDTGSLKYSKDMVAMLVRQAKEHVSRLEANEEAKSFLLGIANYMVERDY